VTVRHALSVVAGLCAGGLTFWLLQLVALAATDECPERAHCSSLGNFINNHETATWIVACGVVLTVAVGVAALTFKAIRRR